MATKKMNSINIYTQTVYGKHSSLEIQKNHAKGLRNKGKTTYFC